MTILECSGGPNRQVARSSCRCSDHYDASLLVLPQPWMPCSAGGEIRKESKTGT